LYPNEIYVAAQDVADLPSGLYNHQVMDGSLVELSKAPVGPQVHRALTKKGRSIPTASLLITGIFFRSAWKYRARAFRYVLLDAGHLIENLVLVARAHGYGFSVHYDFDDIALERLLGIDPKREACLAVINLYSERGAGRRVPDETREDSLLIFEEMSRASQTAAAEIHYAAIQEVCAAGNIIKTGEADKVPVFTVAAKTPEEWFSIRADTALKGELPFIETVLKRRSRRNFVPVPMPTSFAMHLMQSLCISPGHENDEGLANSRCMTPGFAAVNIEAFDPGIYLLDTRERTYGLVSSGSSGVQVARVCLDQAWLKNGSLHFVFMANPLQIDNHHGARGYRYAMLNAGRAGQRIYLAATALGLGACGIGAIYDDEARQMLSLNTDSGLLYLVVVGVNKS
jgi:SagB-type dehydrogenase family enzyme